MRRGGVRTKLLGSRRTVAALDQVAMEEELGGIVGREVDLVSQRASSGVRIGSGAKLSWTARSHTLLRDGLQMRPPYPRKRRGTCRPGVFS